MGFFGLFKKPSLRDKLLVLDSQITNLEEFSEKLVQIYNSFYKICYFIGLFGATFIIYILYRTITYNTHFPFIHTSLISLVAICSYSLVSIIFNFLISRVKNKISAKRNEQTLGIEQLKKDQEYDEMIRIIEKYESGALKKRKKGTLRPNISKISQSSETDKNQTSGSENSTFTNKLTDKLANMILLNNPSEMIALICRQCGEHNGLVFPKQYRPFKCISCKKYNEKEEFSDDGEEIISREESHG